MQTVVAALLLSGASGFAPSTAVTPLAVKKANVLEATLPVNRRLSAMFAGPATMDKVANLAPVKTMSDPITKEEVRAAVRAWCDGIVDIGKSYQTGGDYKAKALEHIERHYAFDSVTEGSKLLFKPTLASEYNFRSDLDEFMSYFVGDGVKSEDGGFAIKPWAAVRFDTHGVFIVPGGSSATTSGIYHFTPVVAPDTEVKVEYTFQFIRSQANPSFLKIVLHHSSVPFAK